MKKLSTFLAVFLLCSALMGIAEALPTVYTNPASWLAAVSGSTVLTEDFGSSPAGALPVGTTDIGLFDVTIGGNDESFIGVFNERFQGDIDADYNLSILFSGFSLSPILGFAGDWSSTTTGNRLTVDVNGTIVEFDNYLSGSGNGFLGIVDTTPFSSIIFGTEGTTSVGEGFFVDNFQVASTVPEPTSMLLLGLGLVGLAGLRRRTR